MYFAGKIKKITMHLKTFRLCFCNTRIFFCVCEGGGAVECVCVSVLRVCLYAVLCLNVGCIISLIAVQWPQFFYEVVHSQLSTPLLNLEDLCWHVSQKLVFIHTMLPNIYITVWIIYPLNLIDLMTLWRHCYVDTIITQEFHKDGNDLCKHAYISWSNISLFLKMIVNVSL